MAKLVDKVLASIDITYHYMSLSDLLTWVKENVPEGTKPEDTFLDFDIDYTTGYYDDIQLDAYMKLCIKVWE
jgi:hypothetical protein